MALGGEPKRAQYCNVWNSPFQPRTARQSWLVLPPIQRTGMALAQVARLVVGRAAGPAGRIRFHDLRHTHASVALSDRRTPQSRLGAAGARDHQYHPGHLLARHPRHLGRDGGEGGGAGVRLGARLQSGCNRRSEPPDLSGRSACNACSADTKSWCRGWDSNPQAAKRRRILSPLRLPISPPRHALSRDEKRTQHADVR